MFKAIKWLYSVVRDEPIRYCEGWVFDGEKVVLDDRLQQNKTRTTMWVGDCTIPPYGGEYWFSPCCKGLVLDEHVFDSKQEAMRFAICELVDKATKLVKESTRLNEIALRMREELGEKNER